MHAEAHHIDGLAFEARIGQHRFTFDTIAPAGNDRGPSPKAVFLSTILGCAGMDVAGLLKKHRMNPTKFWMTADADARQEHPRTFPKIEVTFQLEGNGLEAEKVLEAVQLSMTKYCGVSAMISPTSPIHFRVLINATEIGAGEAKF